MKWPKGTSGGPLAIAPASAPIPRWFAVIGFLANQVERLGFATSTAAIVTAVITM
jgi:hypothetical protein